MVNYLIIAEKKSQADKFAEALFDKKRGTGNYSAGGKGGVDVSSILPGEVRIVHFVGHIYEMEMPNKQDARYDIKEPARVNRFGMEIGGGWRSVHDMMQEYPVKLDLDNIKWKLSHTKHRAIANNIKQLYKKAKHVIVATDYDNEGEMIYMNWQKNNIPNPDWGKMYRMQVNVLTKSAIQAAVQQLQPYVGGPDTLVAMRARGFARSVSDYEYGLSFSYYGRELARLMKSDKKGRYGRLKNALLGVVYRQMKAHDDFVEKSTYRVDMVLPDGSVLAGSETMVFEKGQDAEALIANGSLPTQVSVDFSEKRIKQMPKKLFSRNELIVHLNKRFPNALGANGSWNTPLQALYEQHVLLSYPRTDIQYIGQETYQGLSQLLQTPAVQALIDARIKDVEKRVGKPSDAVIDPNTPANPTYVNDKKLEGESHYALVPSENTPTQFGSLNDWEQKVYLEDLMHTMAIFANPSLVRKREYVSGDNFKGTQQRYDTYGYRYLVDDCPPNKDTFPEAGVYEVTYKVSEVKAKRPPLFSISSLLTMMKRNNWGTSATRDSTVDEMVKAKVFKKTKSNLRVEPALADTIDMLLREKLIDFDMTGAWQTALDKVQTEEDALAFIEANRKTTAGVHSVFEDLLL